MANKKKTKIQKLLTRTNKEITADKSERISKGVSNSFQRKRLGVEQKIDKLKDKRERLLDMSADNHTTTRNAIDDLEADGFVDEICQIDEDLVILERRLEIVTEAEEELVG